MKKVARTTKGAARAARQTQAEQAGGPAHHLLHLQQAVGNRALCELLGGQVQRQEIPEEEELVQAKPDLQRQEAPEEEELQMQEEEEPLQGKPEAPIQRAPVPPAAAVEEEAEEEKVQSQPEEEMKTGGVGDVLGTLARSIGGSLKGLLGGTAKPGPKAEGKEVGKPGIPLPPGAKPGDFEAPKAKWKDVSPKPKSKPKPTKTDKWKFEEF